MREKGTELRVCYLNANSLRAHIKQLRLFLAMQLLMHLKAVVETWLELSVEDALAALDNYVILGGTVILKGWEWHFLCISRSQ